MPARVVTTLCRAPLRSRFKEAMHMDTKVVVGLLAGVALLGTYYFEDDLLGRSSSGPLPAEYANGPEALSWLKKSENESALASNRFLETPNAIRFVRQLYDAGALRVIVPQASITDDGVEVYADSLVVTLPKDPTRRSRVWKMCADEIRRLGEDPGDGTDEAQVLLWWD
jgi:hypothetical protein